MEMKTRDMIALREGSQDGSCGMQPPTYLLLAGLVTKGAGRWAGEEVAEVTPIVSPDTRVMCDVTTENLENNIIIMRIEAERAQDHQLSTSSS